MSAGLPAALQSLRDAMADAPLDLDLPSAADARRTRDRIVQQVDDYLLPRLARIDAPLLAVVGGSTGSGKSTIVNSLVGTTVTEPGVLRPTTRDPVLVCHPDDETVFDGSGPTPVLPDLPRVHGEGEAGGLRLVVDPGVPAGIALLDSPDIDSVELAHHDLAAKLLGAADLWLFVTTAARYADAVPWDHLADARERSVALAVVVNRVPPDAGDAVTAHLQQMLAERGLQGTPVFAVDEAPLRDGRIDEAGRNLLEAWLTGLSADAAARHEVVRQSLDGALDSLVPRVDRVADAVDDQVRAVDHLRRELDRRFDDAVDRAEEALGSGTLLRDQVLERFREHVGTADWMDRLQRTVGRARDRLRAAVRREPPVEEEARGAIEQHLVDLLRHTADEACLQVVEAWRAMAGGPDVLADAADRLDRASSAMPAAAERHVDAWQATVLQLVRDRAGGRMALARGLSLGVNSAGVALMVVVFAQTGGLTGGEAVVAGGTAAVSQTLLTAIFGEQAVRDLARDARRDLVTRVEALFAVERARFTARLDDHATADTAAALRESVAEVRQHRSRDRP